MRIRRRRSQPRQVIATLLVIVGFLLGWGRAGKAGAQPSEPPSPAAPTAPTSSTTTDPLPVPATPPTEPACVPSCRSGFLCVQGSCVSACNPPCAANETCTAAQECKPNTPPAPPPPAATVTPPRTDEAPREERKGVHTHDGFFFRIALGLGAYFGDGTMRDNGRDSYEGTISSLALVGELSLGGTVGRGVVLGVGNWNAVALGPTMKGRALPGGAEQKVSEPAVYPFGLVGPFLDWYVNPKEGFHFQTAVGFATGGYEEPGDNHDEIYLTGIGGMLGIGHEWWIGDQWSIGILARGTLASVSGTDPTDANEEHSAILAAPGILLTFSYH